MKIFRPPKPGRHNRYFLDDEEELFVATVEAAHDAAFPYDRGLLLSMAENTAKKIYGKDFTFGRCNNWVRAFERRWHERISKVKNGSIDKHRGNKGNKGSA